MVNVRGDSLSQQLIYYRHSQSSQPVRLRVNPTTDIRHTQQTQGRLLEYMVQMTRETVPLSHLGHLLQRLREVEDLLNA